MRKAHNGFRYSAHLMQITANIGIQSCFIYIMKKICTEKRETHYNDRKSVHIFLNSVILPCRSSMNEAHALKLISFRVSKVENYLLLLPGFFTV